MFAASPCHPSTNRPVNEVREVPVLALNVDVEVRLEALADDAGKSVSAGRRCRSRLRLARLSVSLLVSAPLLFGLEEGIVGIVHWGVILLERVPAVALSLGLLLLRLPNTSSQLVLMLYYVVKASAVVSYSYCCRVTPRNLLPKRDSKLEVRVMACNSSFVSISCFLL